MPLVKVQCTNCGANLDVDNAKDAAICPFCRTPYVVEKAIQYYNTTNQIHADAVNIYGCISENFVINGGVLTQYNGAEVNVAIPHTVVKIGAEVFKGLCIKSVVIPDGVTIICENAFRDCSSLTSVVIPDGVTKIGAFAFSNCSSLTSIVIPDSVTEIGIGVFNGCSSLTRVGLPNSVKKIGEHTFSNCSSLTNIVIPASVTRIDEGAFSGCSSLKEVTISNYQTELSVYVFDMCNVSSVNAPEEWKRRNANAGGLNLEAYATIQPTTKAESGGCYIATCVYGSYDCPSVFVLRRFRDNVLASVWAGRIFIKFYYSVSPVLVKLFGKNEWFRAFWRKPLDRLVEKLKENGFSDFPYRD